MFSFIKEDRGSFTIEATLSVPIFLLLMIFLINFISVCSVYVSMDHAVGETAKVIAANSFPLQDIKLLKKALPDSLAADTKLPGIGSEIVNDIINEALDTGAEILLDSAVEKAAGKLIREFYPQKKLGSTDFRLVEVRLFSKKSKLENGLNHIDLNPEDITIVVVYKVKMPVPFAHLNEFTLSNIAVERAWTDG